MPKPPSIAKQVAEDPAGVVLSLLRASGAALQAGEIKQLLVEAGVDQATADKAWARAQGKVRNDRQVLYVAQARSYRWVQTPGPEELAEALRVAAAAQERIAALEAEVTKLATAQPTAADTPHEAYERAERRRAARERQARIDAMSSVAELAAEVEELTAKHAAPDVLLEHTRALVGDRGLEAIGRAGEPIPYDEASHEPVGDFPDDGETVIVIRPGYLWHAPGEAVLISKALVTRK